MLPGPAEVLYSSIPNHAKLSSCHVHLAEYQAAVEAAKKANNPKVWKEVQPFAKFRGCHQAFFPDFFRKFAAHFCEISTHFLGNFYKLRL